LKREIEHMTAVAALALEAAPSPAPVDEIDGVIERAIVGFLNGETDGQVLLHALYDSPLDEPVPERMLALVRAHKQS
jgi:hypothetical protein